MYRSLRDSCHLKGMKLLIAISCFKHLSAGNSVWENTNKSVTQEEASGKSEDGNFNRVSNKVMKGVPVIDFTHTVICLCGITHRGFINGNIKCFRIRIALKKGIVQRYHIIINNSENTVIVYDFSSTTQLIGGSAEGGWSQNCERGWE